MFHHFHDDKLHKQGQGSISKDEFNENVVKLFLNKQINLNSYKFDKKLFKDPYILKS